MTTATSVAADATWAHTAAATTAVPKVTTTYGKTPAAAMAGGEGRGSTAAAGGAAKSVVANAPMGRTGGTSAIVAVGTGVSSTHCLTEGTGLGGVPLRCTPPVISLL